MKTNLKLAIAAICVTAFGSINAQQTTGDITKEANVVPGTTTTGGAIKVIDNKGTIKYLQVKNGITTLSNTTADVTTTTWQLGGVITDNTTLTLNDGTDDNDFVIDGVNYSLENIATTAVTSATATSAVSGTNTGYTLLVRNEDTGNVEKLLATDLVSGIRAEFTQGANATADVPLSVPGLPVLTPGTTDAKLFVFRNGAKLRSGTDFVATLNTVTITYSAAELPMFAGDVIEIQYIK